MVPMHVDGLRSPRTHIWTFASGLFNGTNGDSFSIFHCPCDSGNTYGSPLFIRSDYFCDSVATENNWPGLPGLFSDNALWDGQDLLNPCYGLNNPPWLNKTLPKPTSDDIELRMCFDLTSSFSNIALDQLEVYVQ